MKRRSPFPSPKQNSPRGVGFFQQFPRQFLRPYGQADKAPLPETVFKRVKPFTCEWLLRPKVAMSEMADTVLKNTEVINSESDRVLSSQFVKRFSNALKPVSHHLQNLTKDNEVGGSETDVVETLKFLYQDNDDLDSMMDEMFYVGGALFATAAQYVIARTLIRCPEIYSQNVEAEDGSDAKFHKEKDIVSMRDFLVNSIVGNFAAKPLTSPRRNLLSHFDSPAKSPTVPMRKTTLQTSSDSSSSESSSSDESPPPASQVKKVKFVKSKSKVRPPKDVSQAAAPSKTNGLQLLAEDEKATEKTPKNQKKTAKAKKSKQ